MIVSQIKVKFPVKVELPDGFEQTLTSLIEMVCKKYEKEHPDRIMWTFGVGYEMIHDDPSKEIEVDDSVFCIEVAERRDIHNKNKRNKNEN